MSGTSATGGFVTSVAEPPPAAVVVSTLQQMMAALSGLPGNLVRPRWQPVPPTQPSPDTTWGSIGIIQIDADQYPYIQHVGVDTLPGQTNPGYDLMQRHVTITVIASFYGPEAEETSARFRDALYIQQNYEPLAAIGYKLRTVEDLARNAELINQQFIDRLDLRLEFRAQVNRTYPIFDLYGAVVQERTDTGVVTTITVEP